MYLTKHVPLPVCCPGGNYRGVFALGLVQGEWKMYVKWPLDREECSLYIINVTASDGLFVSQATVEVTVLDTNDNSPICNQVRNKAACCSVATIATVKDNGKWQYLYLTQLADLVNIHLLMPLDTSPVMFLESSGVSGHSTPYTLIQTQPGLIRAQLVSRCLATLTPWLYSFKP